MSVITFWNYKKQETGKTMSLTAIATYMATEYNVKTLIISTTNKKDKIKNCYWKEEKKKVFDLGIFGPNNNALETETGIRGLEKIIRSNKMAPNLVTNYAKVVFKDRLEILLGSEEKSAVEGEFEGYGKIQESYLEVINAASEYYDRVFIDLDYNVKPEIREQIFKKSDIIVVNLSQGLTCIKDLKENKQKNKLLKSPKTLLLIGRYDKTSKYNIKNVSRFLGEKNLILTVPYNTAFFEAVEEAGVPDMFLNFKRIREQDENFFLQEIKRATDNIIYRLQEI